MTPDPSFLMIARQMMKDVKRAKIDRFLELTMESRNTHEILKTLEEGRDTDPGKLYYTDRH